MKYSQTTVHYDSEGVACTLPIFPFYENSAMCTSLCDALSAHSRNLWDMCVRADTAVLEHYMVIITPARLLVQ